MSESTNQPTPPITDLPATSAGHSPERRQVLAGGSAFALGWLLSGNWSYAEEVKPPAPKPTAPASNSGKGLTSAVIGLGEQGRAILQSLSFLQSDVKYICDHYTNAQKRAKEFAPKAEFTEEYKKILDDKAVQAVFIATPTHLHKQIVIEALQAGKHVYCEAPLAHTIDDARAIAKAANEKKSQIFQSGLVKRTNPQHDHVLGFVRAGAVGTLMSGQAQYRKRTSWKRVAPTDERQAELNWRLDKELSTGLIGEHGIHSLDIFNWFMKEPPLAVTAWGDVLAWKDGRQIPDTIQCVFEYKDGLRMSFDATLGNSFGGSYEVLCGTQSAILQRDERAWMFKEADAKNLGWEVYARVEKYGDDSGIMLVADATKLLFDGLDPAKDAVFDPRKTMLFHACEAFFESISEKEANAADALAGFQATVSAIKTNEAILARKRLEFDPKWFVL